MADGAAAAIASATASACWAARPPALIGKAVALLLRRIARADHVQGAVDGQVALGAGEPRDARSDELEAGDGQVGFDQRAALEPDGAVERAHRGGALVMRLTPARSSSAAHRLAGGRAERLERTRSGVATTTSGSAMPPARSVAALSSASS